MWGKYTRREGRASSRTARGRSLLENVWDKTGKVGPPPHRPWDRQVSGSKLPSLPRNNQVNGRPQPTRTLPESQPLWARTGCP